MEDSTQNTVKIHDQDEALNYIDTTIRQEWGKWAEDNSYPPLGEAKIIQEAELEGHKVWQYHIDGLPMPRDGRKRWLLDTGETFDTSLSEDKDTLEKALTKLRNKVAADTETRDSLAQLVGVSVEELSLEKIKEKAASLMGVKAEDLSVTDASDIGARFYEDKQGGKAIIIGNDGEFLFADSSVSPSDHVQAYRDGKRNTEDTFNQPN